MQRFALEPYFSGPYLTFASSFPNHASCTWSHASSGKYDRWDVSGIGIKEVEI